MQRFDTKKFMKNVGDNYDVNFIKQMSEHPRDRVRRKTKTLKHPRD